MLLKDKSAWSWIQDNSNFSVAFIAGYIDAEGNFIINQGRARLKIDSYDFDVLEWMSKWLRGNGIDNKFRCIYKKGDLEPAKKYFYKSDLWRLNVNKASSLLRLLKVIGPSLKHENRIKGGQLCLKNIKHRIINGTSK